MLARVSIVEQLAAAGVRRVYLCERRAIYCLVDAVDYEWIGGRRYNVSWKPRASWKLYAKRNTGPARSTVYLHREIMLRADEVDAEFAAAHHVHHVNAQQLDNRRCNLAWAPPEVNSAIRVKRGAAPSLDEIERMIIEAAQRGGAAPSAAAVILDDIGATF